MRIKKKYVILESLLIDITEDLTPFQKKILKILHKKYPDPSPVIFPSWEAALFLIEEIDIEYQDAYDIVRTYSRHGEKLFKDEERESLYVKAQVSHVFKMNRDKAIENYIETNPHGKQIEVLLQWDVDPKEETSDGEIWNAYNGFSLYLPSPSDMSWRGEDLITNVDRGLLVKVEINDIEDNDEEMKVTIIVKRSRGSDVDDSEEKVFAEYNLKYPDKITKQYFYNFFEELVMNTIMDVSSVTWEEKGWWV